MEIGVPWAAGERPLIMLVGARGVPDGKVSDAAVRLRVAVSHARRAADVLDAVRDELAAVGLELQDLGMTPASWVLEIRLAQRRQRP